jgi:hypothetical protein
MYYVLDSAVNWRFMKLKHEYRDQTSPTLAQSFHRIAHKKVGRGRVYCLLLGISISEEKTTITVAVLDGSESETELTVINSLN